MIKTVILEWDFSPPDYFEEPVEISCDNYIKKIEAGNATATIDYSVFSENPSLREDLRVSLNNRFHAAQLLSH